MSDEKLALVVLGLTIVSATIALCVLAVFEKVVQ